MSFEYVEFPALGLRVPVARTLFKVFGQDIYTYAIIIALSIVFMIILGLRHGERYGIRQDTIIDLMIFAMPASIICARLYYVIFSWDNYKNNPIEIFNIRQGGIAIYGSVIGAFLTVLIFSKVKKISAMRFLDFGVPYLILAQGIGRWGNFVNQEVFGTNTTLPWGMTSPQISAYLASHEQWLASFGIAVDPAKPVHPTFLYESLWCILVACVLFWLRRRMKYKGEVFFGYLIGYGAGRAFIEGIRTDSLMLGGIRISQLISILAVVGCLIVVIFFRKKLPLYADDKITDDESAEAPAYDVSADGGGDGASAHDDAEDGAGEGGGVRGYDEEDEDGYSGDVSDDFTEAADSENYAGADGGEYESEYAGGDGESGDVEDGDVDGAVKNSGDVDDGDVDDGADKNSGDADDGDVDCAGKNSGDADDGDDSEGY